MIKDKLLVEDEADRYGRNKITATYKSVETCIVKSNENFKRNFIHRAIKFFSSIEYHFKTVKILFCFYF